MTPSSCINGGKSYSVWLKLSHKKVNVNEIAATASRLRYMGKTENAVDKLRIISWQRGLTESARRESCEG